MSQLNSASTSNDTMHSSGCNWMPSRLPMRTIKEALYIRVNNPSLNRNIGKYHLPHIWDEVLLNISELNLNKINADLW